MAEEREREIASASICIRLKPSQLARLNVHCENAGKTRANVVRKFLDNYLSLEELKEAMKKEG